MSIIKNYLNKISLSKPITYKNMKQTFTCPAPKAILADVGVMALTVLNTLRILRFKTK